MKAAFDDSALSYDADFTDTPIGRMQRGRVWLYLQQVYKKEFPQHVLELNCGTGEDAKFFAEHGSHVLATDISENMLNITRHKISTARLEKKVETKQLDISHIAAYSFDKKFDLIFSNFGGLNCINPEQLATVLTRATQLLNPNGRLLLVLMPRFCAWESLYYLCNFNIKKAFRRRKPLSQLADLGTNHVNIWYHHPSAVRKIAAEHFKINYVQPIGITVPPSYMQHTFISRKAILNTLYSLEQKMGTFRMLSGMADHYLIDLQLK